MITATAIAISIASYHFDREVKHNEVNPGIFLELNHDYVVGVYRNSLYRTTVLAGYSFNLLSAGAVRLGGIVAACTGYNSPVCGGLTLSYGPHITLLLAPPVSGTSAVVGISWRQPL